MIYLNTDRLLDIVQNLDSASKQIDEAAAILMDIPAHEDWCCDEKYKINENILDNRAKILQLQEKGTNFYSTVKNVVDDFVDTESNISQLFENLDNKLGSILMWNSSSALGGNVVNITDHFLKNITAALLNPVQTTSGLLEPLVLVGLKDFNFWGE